MHYFVAVVLAALSLMSTPAARADVYLAPGFTCDHEDFVVPTVMDNGIFKATMAVNCQLIGSSGAGLPGLDRYLLAGATQGVEKVNSGPLATTLNGLPAVKYDVTKKGDGKSHMRQDVIVGYDQATKLSYGVFTTEMIDAGMVQKLDIQLDFVKNANGTYAVKFTNTLHLKKPALIPGGAFKSVAEKKTREQFLQQRDQSLTKMVEQL